MPVAVPHADRDDAARPDDAAHLGDAGRRVVHEVDHELRERGVERPVRPRKLLGAAPPARRRREAGCSQRGDERRRRIGGGDVRAAPGELGGQRAGARADVEHALARRDAGEVGEDRREPHRVPAHEVVVGGVRDVEHRPELFTLTRSRRVELDDRDVEPGERVAQREPPRGEGALERGQRAAAVRAGQRPARRHGGVAARVGELERAPPA